MSKTSTDRILEQIFSAPPGRRTALLTQLCGGDEARLRRIVKLLEAEASIKDSFLRIADDSRDKELSTLGRYEIIEKIGEGGMGRVYRARDLQSDRLVALKIISPFHLEEHEIERQYFRELRALAAINHENVVAVYDFAKGPTGPYIVMPLLKGRDLASHLAGSPPWPTARRMDIARQAAVALDQVHRQRLVHGDVKPSNLFVEDSGQVKLLDFGATRRRESLLESLDTAVGTPSYMAPELLLEGRLTVAADFFSFGVVLFELLTEEKPFPTRSLTETFDRGRFDDPPLVKLTARSIAPPVVRLVADCLSANPQARPHSFAAIASLLVL